MKFGRNNKKKRKIIKYLNYDCNYDYIIKELLTGFVENYCYHRIVKYIYLNNL